MQRSLSFSEAIDLFVLYLATEKGLSVNYQLSNRRSLPELVAWFRSRDLLDPGSVQTTDLGIGSFAQGGRQPSITKESRLRCLFCHEV